MRNERDIIQSHIADPNACASMVFTSGANTGLLETDTAALKTAIDANNTAIDSILLALERQGIVASS